MHGALVHHACLKMAPSRISRHKAAGFTLMEIIFTVVILGVLAKFAMMKLITPVTLTLPSQAQSVADAVRRAQSMAVVRGHKVRVSAAAASSPVSFNVLIAPCPGGACTNDASLTLAVDHGVVLCTTSTVYFNSLGAPVVSAAQAAAAASGSSTFSMSATDACTAPQTITVTALTGRVSVSP